MKKLSLLFLMPLLFSCEKVIDIDTIATKGEIQISVYAFLSTDPVTQEIELYYTKPIGSKEEGFKPVTGADITVKNMTQNRSFSFMYENSEKTYFWNKNGNDSLGTVGDEFELHIVADSKTYRSRTEVLKTIKVDSIKYHEPDEDGAFGESSERTDAVGFGASKEVEFFATDIPGEFNFYWVRYKHSGFEDPLLSNIVIASNAGFSKDNSDNSTTDGFVFIEPLRKSLPSAAIGEKIEISISSITEDTFDFFISLRNKSENTGLFATTDSNILTNIISPNNNEADKMIGWFSVSKTSEPFISIAK